MGVMAIGDGCCSQLTVYELPKLYPVRFTDDLSIAICIRVIEWCRVNESSDQMRVQRVTD